MCGDRLEVWKDIKGYEGLYQVSNFGRVRSLDRYVEQMDRWGNIASRLYKGKVLSQKISKSGYSQVQLFCARKRGKSAYVQRLVADAFVPNPDNFPEVNHIDENKSNNNSVNLEWCDRYYNTHYGTRNDKIRDYMRKTRAKISTKEVEKIKLLSDNKSVREIAQMFGISYSQVRRILSGANWRDVK